MERKGGTRGVRPRHVPGPPARFTSRWLLPETVNGPLDGHAAMLSMLSTLCVTKIYLPLFNCGSELDDMEDVASSHSMRDSKQFKYKSVHRKETVRR